jgi:hypothetical protein
MRKILFVIIPVLVSLIVVSNAFSQNRSGPGSTNSIVLTGNQDLSGQSSRSSVTRSVVKTIGQRNSAPVGAQAYAYSIYDCWWEDSVDMGFDGYTQSRWLCIDVDVNDGSTRSVFLNIYTKAASSPFWVFYRTTYNFDITGISSEKICVFIGSSNQELNRDSYDFIIEVCEAGGTTSMASRGPTDDGDLKGQHFETEVEDKAGCPYSIADCYWQNTFDIDRNGYTEHRDLYIDVRRALTGNDCPYTIYFKICGRIRDLGGCECYYETEKYIAPYPQILISVRIGGVENGELRRETYDFRVDLWIPGILNPVRSWGAGDDADLRDQLFEISTPNDVEDEIAFPQAFHLSQNYPNPFNPSTTIGFQIPKSGQVKLTVYDLFGKEVKTLINKEMRSGSHQCVFDGSGLASGVYLYRLQSNGYVQSKKFVLLK